MGGREMWDSTRGGIPLRVKLTLTLLEVDACCGRSWKSSQLFRATLALSSLLQRNGASCVHHSRDTVTL